MEHTTAEEMRDFQKKAHMESLKIRESLEESLREESIAREINHLVDYIIRRVTRECLRSKIRVGVDVYIPPHQRDYLLEAAEILESLGYKVYTDGQIFEQEKEIEVYWSE